MTGVIYDWWKTITHTKEQPSLTRETLMKLFDDLTEELEKEDDNRCEYSKYFNQ